MHTVSLVIPVYNGEKVLPNTCAKLRAFFTDRPFLHEVVFVNDGSNDSTAAILAQFASSVPFTVRVINLAQNGGKGRAVHTGVMQATSPDYIFFCDDDIPFGFEPIELMYQKMESDQHVDFCTADRSLVVQHNPYPLHRKIGSKVYGALLPRAIGLRFPDMHGGTKGFRAPVAKAVFAMIRNFRWSFDPEIFLIAEANGFTAARIPAHFMPHVQGTHFKITDFVSVAREMLRMHFNSLAGRYKKRV